MSRRPHMTAVVVLERPTFPSSDEVVAVSHARASMPARVDGSSMDAPGRCHLKSWAKRERRWVEKYVLAPLRQQDIAARAARKHDAVHRRTGPPARRAPTLTQRSFHSARPQPATRTPVTVNATGARTPMSGAQATVTTSLTTPTTSGQAEYNFMRRNVSARRKAFRLADGAEPRVKTLPALVWSTSRKAHNRRMHALNGNTATPTTAATHPLTDAQLATVAANRQAALLRRQQLATIAANRAEALARKAAKRARSEAGLQPPNLWKSADWRPPTVPAAPTDFLKDNVPEEALLGGISAAIASRADCVSPAGTQHGGHVVYRAPGSCVREPIASALSCLRIGIF